MLLLRMKKEVRLKKKKIVVTLFNLNESGLLFSATPFKAYFKNANSDDYFH